MNPDITRYVPVGMPYRDLISGYFAYLGCAVLFSFGFLIRYLNALEDLYIVEKGVKIIREGTLLADFHQLIGRFFALFYVMMIAMILVGIYFYVSHYKESKSIYLMRRLPQKKELWTRCLTLPLLGAIMGLVIWFLLLITYYLIYMNVTPQQCIPPDQWQKLWSVIL